MVEDLYSNNFGQRCIRDSTERAGVGKCWHVHEANGSSTTLSTKRTDPPIASITNFPCS